MTGQVAVNALGVQDGFSLKGVALGAIGGAGGGAWEAAVTTGVQSSFSSRSGAASANGGRVG